MSDFLLEIGLEEVPAGVLPSIRTQLKEQFSRRLGEEHLGFESLEVLYTLRRLVIHAGGLSSHQPDREEDVLGPPRSAALDASGAPTKAAAGFARGRGVAVEDCRVIRTEKGEYFGFTKKIPGRPASEILPALCTAAFGALTFPKAMRWGEGAVTFVRPVRWILALLDGSALTLELCGIAAANLTRLNRFLPAPEAVVSSWESYRMRVEASGIVLEAEERRRSIAADLEREAGSAGGLLRPDAELLEIVADLVERPMVVCGEFSTEFLELPQEILMTSMREHQKHFSILDVDGRLMPLFLAVAEAAGGAAGPDAVAQIRHGNERVLRARLDDARFFWQDDARQTLDQRAGRLDHVLFQKGLGNYRDKCDRILKTPLCEWVPSVDRDAFRQAAQLSKADLTTDMVKEFTSLQGIVGGLYARREGLSERVWKAIYDQYLPVAPDDRLPSTDEGSLLSLADRLDTLAGCFGLGHIPTGSRDPLGLRRLAQGAVRICAEKGWHVSLVGAFSAALDAYGSIFSRPRQDVMDDFKEFLDGRLRLIFDPYGYDLVNAVIGDSSKDPADIEARLDGLSRVIASDDFRAIAVSFKRIKNILRDQPVSEFVAELCKQEEEIELDRAFREVAGKVEPLLASRSYEAALLEIAALRPRVDRFFDKVLVMDGDPQVRSNRLGLLQAMAALFLRIADFSEIDVEKRSQ